MEFKQLEAFHALLKHGTYSKAAKSLYVSQPTITVRLQLLEEELGIKLFERSGKGYKPTTEGNIFAHYALDILKLQSESLKAINERKGLSSGNIKIGATSFGTYILPAVAKTFQESFHGVRLLFSISNTKYVIDSLFEENIDLALVSSSIEKAGTLVFLRL